jgi:hypothetical protein
LILNGRSQIIIIQNTQICKSTSSHEYSTENIEESIERICLK